MDGCTTVGPADLFLLPGLQRNGTPLLAACEWSTPEVVELLLYYGADIHHKDIVSLQFRAVVLLASATYLPLSLTVWLILCQRSHATCL